jgi:hypothetical protein
LGLDVKVYPEESHVVVEHPFDVIDYLDTYSKDRLRRKRLGVSVEGVK